MDTNNNKTTALILFMESVICGKDRIYFKTTSLNGTVHSKLLLLPLIFRIFNILKTMDP